MVRGPFAWVPAPWLTRSQWVVPLPSRFVHLQLLHQATALKTSRRWPAAARDVLSILDADAAPLAHPWRTWHRSFAALVLSEWAPQATRWRETEDSQSLQSRIYQSLQAASGHNGAEALWERCLHRWGSLAVRAPFARVLRERAHTVMEGLASCPPSTRWALGWTWLNGWCTARRFQQSAQCTFCGRGEDSIEHFSRCPTLRELGSRRLQFGLCQQEPLRWLLLDGNIADSRDLILRAVFLHAIYRAHCSHRKSRRPEQATERV